MTDKKNPDPEDVEDVEETEQSDLHPTTKPAGSGYDQESGAFL